MREGGKRVEKEGAWGRTGIGVRSWGEGMLVKVMGEGRLLDRSYWGG